MQVKRRAFMAGGLTTAGLVGIAGAQGASDAVTEEVNRRKRYLSPPDGAPSDIEAAPSPAVMPFADPLYVPPVAMPLIDMFEEVAGQQAMNDEDWWAAFSDRFYEKKAALADQGINIGDLPVPDAHQRFFEFRPVKFYVIREREFAWAYHSDYCGGHSACAEAVRAPKTKAYFTEDETVAVGSDATARPGVSWTWGFETVWIDEEGAVQRIAGSPGPTFKARYDEPILVRRINDLPEIGNSAGHSRLRFALPSTTTHLHNAHTASESDGFPNDWVNPGEYWDHHYGNFASGHDEREKLATLWYHDHRMDFTAANVYAGLDGFYFLFDEKDADDETSEGSWRLPSGKHDVPLIFHDLYFQNELPEDKAPGEPTPQLVFDGFNTDGILGDRFTVNRIIQPKLDVEARKYRFRILNGGPSRFYEFILYDEDGKKVDEKNGAFIVITGDGNFQPNPILAKSIYIGVAQRVDVIIDFSRFRGKKLYLVNQLEQINGRGPTERRLEPMGDAQAFLDTNAVMRFDVAGKKVEDPSFIPLLFRELPPVDLTEAKRERVWEFDYDGGLWTINGKTYEPNRVDAGIEQDSAEIWTFRNTGNSWHHPIHSHFTEFIILEINGRPHYQSTIQTDDIADYRDEVDDDEDPGDDRYHYKHAFPSLKRLKKLLEKLKEKVGDKLEEIPPGTKLTEAEQELLDAYRALPEGVKQKVDEGRFDEILFLGYEDFSDWANRLSLVGFGDATLESFMGGPRRDVALILPNWEVKVFMRWKDFLGRHVMHCHNVVHEDHAMMIRWEIMPKGEGFDTPKHQDEIAQVGKREKLPRSPHVENHPRTAVKAVDDSENQ